MVAAGQLDQGSAVFGAHAGGIDDRQPPSRETLCGDGIDEFEGLRRHRLIGLVIRHQCAASVRGYDLGGKERARRKGRLAGAASADQDDESEIRNAYRHVKTPIWVGAPSSASAS